MPATNHAATLLLPVLALVAGTGCDASDTPDALDSTEVVEPRIGVSPNDCGHPFWADTLRCEALSVTGTMELPQENFGTAPTSASEIGDFTRVFLPPDTTVRCYDGTIPVIYVDEAVNPSDDWLISFRGGGSCVPSIDPVTGAIDASVCTETYESEGSEMGSAYQPPMKDLNPQGGMSGGINNPDPTINPVFANYNRVRIEKCSYDRYTGRATFPGATGVFDGSPVTYDAHQQGWAIAARALAALRSGLAYTTWSVDPMTDEVEADDATLPPLQDAETILFVGHSGGAHGLMHNIDALADGLASAGITADVRALFDANFIESGENEAAFATDSVTGMPLSGDFWSGHYAGTSVASAPVHGMAYDFTYDLADYFTDPIYPLTEQYENWAMQPDQSCLDAHAISGDEWLCRDRMHVLFNHVATPMFVREDFSDPNKEHTLGGIGHPVMWADALTGAACAATPMPTACPPLLSMVEHRQRLEAQADAVTMGLATDSEMGAEDVSLVGQQPSLHLFMPDCANHSGAFDSPGFFNTELSLLGVPVSMREAVEDFMADVRYDAIVSHRDGGATSSICPP